MTSSQFQRQVPSRETLDFWRRIEPVARHCILAERYFNLIRSGSGQFWSFTHNALGEQACLLWCHLFGNRGDDLYYAKFFSLCDVTAMGHEFTESTVKSRLLSRIEMNEVEYRCFWDEVRKCRDKYIAHRDDEKVYFPYIDKCREMAEELRVILKEVFEAWLRNDPSNADLQYYRDHYREFSNQRLAERCQQNFEFHVPRMAKKILTAKADNQD